MEFDGGSRGNPGPAGIGVVIRAADGTPLVTLGRYIGKATNNVAEYTALITAMQKARELGVKRVKIHGDSELIVRQMKGTYRVKHPDLLPLYQKARDLFESFEQATIDHNYRHKNELADRLGNLAMDRRAEVTETNTNESPLDTPSSKAPEPGDTATCPRCGCKIQVKNPSKLRPHQLRDFTCQCGAKMHLD